MTKMSETFSIYLERRMARILLLGIISGFPWVLIGSSLSLWLKEDGLSRSTIGWAGLIFGVYAFNFLWAPLIDRLRVPYLTPRLGHRRAWIVTLQALILVCLGGVEPGRPFSKSLGCDCDRTGHCDRFCDTGHYHRRAAH